MGKKHSKEQQSLNEAAATSASSIETIEASTKPLTNESKAQQVKVIIQRITPLENTEPKVIVHSIAVEEEPAEDLPLEQPAKTETCESTLQIQEVSSDHSLSELSDNAALISEAESDPETPTKSAEYVELKQKRAQKRAALETHFLPQLLSPRYLDSISEENSDLSDCSERTGNVVGANADQKAKGANVKFPHSNLDFSKKHKHGELPNTIISPTIREEPQALIVEAKMIEQLLEQSCSTLSSVHHEPQSEAAELVFINSSTSSSLSDLNELNEEPEAVRETVDLDTDVCAIISKPTDDERESTPVNQPSSLTTAISKQSCVNNEAECEHLTVGSDEHETSANAELQCSAVNSSDSSPASNSSTIDASVEDSAEALARLESTCREIMDSVRDIVYANKQMPEVPLVPAVNGLAQSTSEFATQINGKRSSASPPPIPPPPRHLDLKSPSVQNPPDMCEPPSPAMQRQESTESHCSSSTNQSQCTAINLGAPSPPPRAYDVSSNLLSDAELQLHSRIAEVEQPNLEQIGKLRQLCTQKLASLPYGEQVLEELATLAQNIGEGRVAQVVPHINELQASLAVVPTPSVTAVEAENQLLDPSASSETLAAEQEILATAAAMRKLRKSLTPPPPPVPPPPVPTRQTRIMPNAEHDVSARNANAKEQQQNNTFSVNGETREKVATSNDEVDNKKPLISATSENENNTMKTSKTSSFENNSRQEAVSSIQQTSSQSSRQQTENKPVGMQGMETELGRMFPGLGESDIFNAAQKRFSNIESTTGSNRELGKQEKRYSNIETHSYEAQKRIENGHVVLDYANSQHESQSAGDPAHVNIHDKSQVAPDIMSALKLNEAKTPAEIKNSTLTTDTTSSHMSKTYEEFRQRAKAEALKNPLNKHFDQEKLFKDFDELSQQLHHELETGREQREQREKSASLFDLSQSKMKQQFEELKRKRHEHMLELEREIERSMRSRQTRREMSCEAQEQQKVHDIPIQLENGQATKQEHQIPTKLQNGYSGPKDMPGFEHDSNSPFRRAESMFNLTQNAAPAKPESYARPSTPHSNYESQQQHLTDDWSQYASDLGSSENISRPFAREMQICYQRQNQPRSIRAPRLTVSTNDLSAAYAPPTYDSYNAYNVRRSQAPMLNQLSPQPTQYSSCYSVLERDPNPTYISTTSRRGVSPAPPAAPVNPRPREQRRASLPREIQEQQLKYITNKEEELRLEFERLQNERRRLMEELTQENQPNEPQVPPRPLRDNYRPQTRLPTLSEDEVFRQQMAEEWLNKVAEREERRLQKIIKISKLHEQQHEDQLGKTDISQEFLNRVKERRSKLHMPADSDWESGAESQPQRPAPASETEDLAPALKVLSGRSVANLNQLPRHLKEFARYSNQETEQLPGGGQREIFNTEESRQEADGNSLSSSSKKASSVKTVKISRLPPQTHTPRQGRPYKIGGYQSEPEPNYDSDYSTVKYRTLDRRRLQSCSSNVNVRNNTHIIPIERNYGTLPNDVKSSSYKIQPGRIENYVTGNSSIAEKEKKEWWDEVMDIFNGNLDQGTISPRYEGNLSRALAKESGYASDSNLVFRKKDLTNASPLSPVEQKQVYKSVQAGGEPPLLGFRKAAPEKPKDYTPFIPTPPPRPLQHNGNGPESPNRYFESDVNIHYKAPVRNEYKIPLSEEELALRQAEHMRKLYQEERRRKYLQEMHDMNSRRHTDNFSPAQKSPIPLNRYDDFQADLAPKSPNFATLPKTAVRALYNFQGQSARELSFKKGDVIFIRRQIDKNWYEGEHNAMIGLFPANYVEVITKDVTIRQPVKRPSEGQARAKYNFQAQSGVELSINKGELVALTRRVDDNWFEGRVANRKGIFPVSYVEVLTDIGAEDIAAKTVVPDHKAHMDALRTDINNEFNQITRNGHQAPNGILKETRHLHKTNELHVDTSSASLAYRALYKYRPQNSDELELLEGDIIHVLEKCDDGWFVGTSQRTGCFGTFPGNYVERI